VANESPTLHPRLLLPWHELPRQRFADSLSRGQVAHALLLHGEGGSHKVHLARQFGQALLCQQPVSGVACGKCHSCLLCQAGNHPDWTEVQPVESAMIRVDQIRELSARLSMRPQIAQRQVALLWPSEQMNPASSNALLKTLEEPAADTHLLLVSDRAGRLSATIRSRCQRMPIIGSKTPETVSTVAQMAGVSAGQALAALELSGGDPELGLHWLAPEHWSAIVALSAQLVDLAHGRLDASSFAGGYRKESVALLQRWSRLIALMLGSDKVDAGAFKPLVALAGAVQYTTLLPLATQLERARGMIGSGVREDLMVYDLAVRWSEAFTTQGRRRES
jgi:DNA polymerase III subunit delta'